MLYEIVNDFPNDIIFEEKGLFISLYQPTHRYRPENKQDLIRFENLIHKIENSLKERHQEKDIKLIMKPFKDLAEDRIFWNNTADGLAILSNGKKCIVYKLQNPVEELALVSDRFHIKPLIRYFQSADRYHLLGLDRKRFTLYEGNRYGFEEVKLDPDIPRTLEDVIGDEHTEPYLNPGSYGGAAGTPMFHGHGGRKDEIDKDIERYFRYIDKFVLDDYSNPMKTPLILVALDANHGFFNNISNNPYLMEKGINQDYNTLDMKQMRKSAWEIIEPFYLEKTKKLVDRYNVQRSKFEASDDLSEITRAALNNRVDLILLEADRMIAGKINKETGELKRNSAKGSEFDNILDELAMMVLKFKGEVVILPKERMPSTTGAAAIFRY